MVFNQSVIPVKTGISCKMRIIQGIPAFAGMTDKNKEFLIFTRKQYIMDKH